MSSHPLQNPDPQILNESELRYIIYHLILPPNTPQEAEQDQRRHSQILLRFLCQVAGRYAARDEISGDYKLVAKKAKRILDLTQSVQDPHGDFEKHLTAAIVKLGFGDAFALHISEQNAGLLVRRVGYTLRFEAFEASPLREVVVNCKGSLRCTYPGPATAIPWRIATDTAFLAQVSAFLAHMDTHPFIEETACKSRKGGDDLSEERDTNDPRYIIELFTGMMRGLGEEIKVDRIEKNVRDEVNYYSAQKPWRRSPLWLIIRIILQTTFARDEYKIFMLEIIRAILSEAVQLDLDSYTLSCINKKLARRLDKIGSTNVPEVVLAEIIKTIQEASDKISHRWNTLKSRPDEFLAWDPKLEIPSNIERNTYLELKKFSVWYQERKSMFSNPPSLQSRVNDPTERIRHIDPFTFPKLEISSTANEWNQATNLFDFEQWIKDHLESWCRQAANDTESLISTLATVIEDYHKKATLFYGKDNVLSNSIMLLTIMELWVQLDKAVCAEEPLLQDYSPEIPHTILNPILLVQKADMERLRQVEGYLEERRSQCKNRSIFNASASWNSFSYFYYENSIRLQHLRNNIVGIAHKERDAKEEELKRLNQEHTNLKTKASRMGCDYYQYYSYGKSRTCHSERCEKCALNERADNMKISVHEWPLPEAEAAARLVLFELQPPRQFSLWRNSTYYIMIDVCSTDSNSVEQNSDHWGFESWPGLAAHRQQASRVTFVSEAKPLTSSHYEARKIPAIERDILRKHAGVYGLFDLGNREWITSRHQTCTTEQLCRSEVSDMAYKNLSYAVNSVGHTSNQVLAEQHRCHPNLTLHEYEAFALLRSGGRLQWHNILRELRKDTLTFKKEAVYTLILHAACHVGGCGEISDWKRESHITLTDELFSAELVKTLRENLGVIRDNWEQANFLKVLVLLARRVLSCGHKNSQSDTFDFLRSARKVCHTWVASLQLKLEAASEESAVQHFRDWLLRVLSIKCSTFDVDESLLCQFSFQGEDVVEFLVTQNFLYDNCLGITSNLPHDLKQSLESNRRFTIISEPFIKEILEDQNSRDEILTAVTSRILPTHSICGSWKQLPAPSFGWWKLEVPGNADRKASIIHLDSIQGRLLVDGKPNGRLPQEYFAHEHYKSLLGKRIFDVVPSNFPDMSYQSRNKIFGVTLHFHHTKSTLFIRKEDETTHEFVPPEIFAGDIPKPIYLTGSQWLNFKDQKVIFHLDGFWWKQTASVDDWNLVPSSKYWSMGKQNVKLLDIHDDIYATLNRLLSPIECSEHIVTTVKGSDNVIDIDLPRYKLQFFVNSQHRIESRTHRGWTIDKNQTLPTFIGLKSFLKLRFKLKHIQKESIIVPYGEIGSHISPLTGHADVWIDPGDEERSYTVFSIDRILNRVSDDGSLNARYTRLYLHALTSGILPDPLTQHTGVEEALEGLRNAASFSFQMLSENEANILNKIADLTPTRSFYPDHKRVMQQTSRSERIPIWVQNELFYFVVKDILDNWNRRQFLILDSRKHPIASLGSEVLLERARNRNSIFWPADPFAADRNIHSSTHQPRHRISESETYVEEMARASLERFRLQNLKSNMLTFLSLKRELSGFNDTLTLAYSPQWARTDAAREWCSLYELCRRSTPGDRFAIAFTFAFLVYRNPEHQALLKSLLAVAVNPETFSTLALPNDRSFEPSIGGSPLRADIESFIKSDVVSYPHPKYTDLPRKSYESEDAYQDRKYNEYFSQLQKQVDQTTDHFMNQWPTRSPDSPEIQRTFLLRLSGATEKIKTRFDTCFKNDSLFKHLVQVDLELERLHNNVIDCRPFNVGTLPRPLQNCGTKISSEQPARLLNLLGLMERINAPMIQHVKWELSLLLRPSDSGHQNDVEAVNLLADRLKDSNETFAQKYAEDLVQSAEALKDTAQPRSDVPLDPKKFQQYQMYTEGNVERIYTEFLAVLSPVSSTDRALAMAGLWPPLSKLCMLQTLRIKSRDNLPAEWLDSLLKFGEAITLQQKAQRLLQFQQDSLELELQREILHSEHENWKPKKYVDWLLFEIDSGMLIRPIQAEIGEAMMNDKEGNAVLQLNMGEGKSAVIVPTVVAALADTTKLVRSIIIKPLATQMFHLLVQRLSGLCNRRIYFLPFSRELTLSATDVEAIRALYLDCMAEGAILLTLPEHLLSFKLMGLEKMIRGDLAVSAPLLDVQRWLDINARDVLDESDEILHIRYQLIYTMGQQCALEGSNDRWTLIQEILDLLRAKAPTWANENPSVMEYVPLEAKFPRIRIIDKCKGEEFLKALANEICFHNTDSIPSVSSKLKLRSGHVRELAFVFITSKEITMEQQNELLAKCNDLRTQLLVLRGLIAYGVLLFILHDKRFRVDYGLDLHSKRSQLAVPFRAKDQPAVKAEFGHPEVILTLTCLSYYYYGLEDSDLASCFDLLLKADDPDLTYELWTRRHSSIPENLSKLRGLNLIDQDQLGHIYEFFRFNKDVIDFFLSELAFPREAKGFSHKLSTSGWDIAEQKAHVTTGFSGTNDNRYLLPISIRQLDLPKQLHTNSLVIMNILRPENNTIIRAGNRADKAKEILELTVAQVPKIQVLLDVGAAILELDNRELVTEWLRLDRSPNILGAVFFGRNDEILGMTRDGKIEPLWSSPLMYQLDRVLVYLDEAHTRGTDLKLPTHSRAALTLGPNLAKDKFVQGCMRMRKLGKGQSLAFIVPADILAQIQRNAGKSVQEAIDVSDICLWTMLESCRQIGHGFPIWADQGFKYLQRRSVSNSISCGKNVTVNLNALMEVESRPLMEMYGAQRPVYTKLPELDTELSRHADIIRARLEKFDITTTYGVGVQEEQEREVDHEMEEEKLIERPPVAKPKKHSLHPLVSRLARLGNCSITLPPFKPAFSIFKNTSNRSLLEASGWPSNLYVTQDFEETVERKVGEDMDAYLRSVQWVMSTRGGEELVILSPWEANELMQTFRDSSVSKLHCYAPKVSRNMQTFDLLNFCTVSADGTPTTIDPTTRIALNMFAGQLFYEGMEDYHKIRDFLGVYYDKPPEGFQPSNDGWLSREAWMVLWKARDMQSNFTRNPLPFLRELVKMRRKGQGFAATHVGMLLNARELKPEDFARSRQ
ncbi:hypothetical protein AA313_de0209692 [Arthrobotrys entomopaga]|nr:hypothetical protein AA313_de0209692 [Arthrobotrys entomopaga]